MQWHSNIDWAVVLATLVGPIVAVAITLWSQSRFSKKQDRRSLFTTMMRTRRQLTTGEFVGSLNLVPVHFHADKGVMAKYAELMQTFGDPNWHNSKALQGLHEQVETRVAYLLHEMSKAVRTPIDQLSILRGAYSPQGWSDEEKAKIELRDAFMSILTGQRALVVLPLASPITERPKSGIEEAETITPQAPSTSNEEATREV